MIGFSITAIFGLILLISSQNPHVKYAGCFFYAMGIYPNVPQGVAWNGNNIGGSVKRGVGIAMHVGFGKSWSIPRKVDYANTDPFQVTSEVLFQDLST